MKTTSKRVRPETEQLFSLLEEHLLEDETPSAALGPLLRSPGFDAYPLSMLKKLEETPQSPVHHPEGNVLNHTLRVVDEAAGRKGSSADPRAFMWAALLHDIGKPPTTRTRKGRITAYDHDRAGAEMTREFLSALTEDRRFIEKVTQLVRYHMHILYVVSDLPFKDVEGMRRDSDVREVALLGLCDRLGRKGASRQTEEEQVRRFLSLVGV